MRGVEYHRTARVAHDGEGAHVGYQVVVAEGCAALADHEVVGATRRARLGDDVQHVLGRQELALLDVDRPAGACAARDEVGLAAEEGGCLQHVDHRGGLGDLVLGVDVGQHRDADLPLDLGQDARPSCIPGPRNDPAELRFALS